MATAPELVPAARRDGAGALRGSRAGAGDRRHLDADVRAARGRAASGRARAVRDGLRLRWARCRSRSAARSIGLAPLVLTVRSVGAVTKALCAAEPGAGVGARAIRGPAGWRPRAATSSSSPAGSGRPCSARCSCGALERRAAYGEVVLYGARTPRDLLYVDELERWRSDATVDVTVDAASPDWRGRVGVVPQPVPGARFDPDAATAFVCGPEIMLRYGVRRPSSTGVAAAERVYVSLERNMRCGVGHCGHCQLGPTLICRDGPVYDHATAAPWLEVRESCEREAEARRLEVRLVATAASSPCSTAVDELLAIAGEVEIASFLEASSAEVEGSVRPLDRGRLGDDAARRGADLVGALHVEGALRR